MTAKPPLTLLIAAPRGFCAGVDRAIRIVELALERYGAPVYVRHEIVHNKFVVDSLKAKGAVFVPELDQVPDGVPVVFSAHGVPKAVPAKAQERGLNYLDATCPLVSKVHRQAERLIERGRHILFVGHAGHPEVIGTFGQVPEGRMTLIETAADAETIAPADPDSLAFLTQTTLSVDDTAEIVAILAPPLPLDPGAAQRGHLLRHLQPPGGGEGDRRALRRPAGDRLAEQLQFAPPRRGRRARGHQGAAGRPRRRYRFRLAGGRAHARHHRRRLGARKCWSARWSTRSPSGSTVTEEPVEGVEERMVFKLPAGLEAA